MALKGIKPKIEEKRLKMFVYGAAGIGKTTAAIQFPNAYIIDTERGTDWYAKSITKSNSAVFKSNNPDDIKAELKELLTTKHQYKTLIIDPITQIYNSIQEKWSRIFEKYANSAKEKDVQDFGMRYWGRVKSEFKSIQRMLIALDMNIIVTAHQKDVYGTGFTKTGVTYDSMKGDDYFFDLIFRISKKDNKRLAIKDKERAEPGEQKFPENFEWSYDNFLKFYGKEIIEKESVPIVLANSDQIKTILNLLQVVKLEESEINKWFNRAKVDSWEDMTSDQITKCINLLNKKLDIIKGENK